MAEYGHPIIVTLFENDPRHLYGRSRVGGLYSFHVEESEWSPSWTLGVQKICSWFNWYIKMTTRCRKRGEIRKGLVNFDRYKRARTERALIPWIRGGVAALSLSFWSVAKILKKVWGGIRTASTIFYPFGNISIIGYTPDHKIIVLPDNNHRNFVDHQITDNITVTFRWYHISGASNFSFRDISHWD